MIKKLLALFVLFPMLVFAQSTNTPSTNPLFQVERAANPVAVANRGAWYTKDVAGITEAFYLDSSGNAVQLTAGGVVAGGFYADNVYAGFGNTAAAPDAAIGWNTAQTVDGWYWGTSAGQNTVILAEYADKAYDFAHGAQTNPTLFIQSAAQSATQWLSLSHNTTDAVLKTGIANGHFSLVDATSEMFNIRRRGIDSVAIEAATDITFLTLDIPLSATDATTHYVDLSIDDNPMVGAIATGDGVGTINVGTSIVQLGLYDNSALKTSTINFPSNFLKIQAGALPAYSTAIADTSPVAVNLITKNGGAHTLNNPDGGDLVFSPGAAGAGGVGRRGQFIFNSLISFGLGVPITASQYSIGRDTSTPEDLHLNVPTNSDVVFSVNGDRVLHMDSGGSLIMHRYSDVADSLQTLFFTRGRGTSAAPAIVQSGDTLGAIYFAGYDGAAQRSAARIQAFVDGTPGAGDMPGRLEFKTTPDGSVTPVTSLLINSKGAIEQTPRNTEGIASKISFSTPTVLSNDFYAFYIDLTSNLTATNQNLNLHTIQFPSVVNTGAGLYTDKGYYISMTSLEQNTLGGTSDFTGLEIHMPNITQTTGTVNSYGVYIDGGTVTSGTEYALFVDKGVSRFDDTLQIITTKNAINDKSVSIVTTATPTTGVSIYGINNAVNQSTVITGTNHFLFGAYNGVFKTGADSSVNGVSTYGAYNESSNLGSGDLGTRDMYGSYNSAVGDTAGTSTAYGVYSTASGADTNWAFYSGNGNLGFGAGVAVVATSYSVNRDADATNQLHFNVPTGGTYEFSVNDVAKLTMNTAGAFSLTPSALTSGVPIAMSITPPANTGITAGSNVPQFNLVTSTQTWATGAVAEASYFQIAAPTFGAAAASTFAQASTFTVTGAPILGANATFAASAAIWAKAGQYWGANGTAALPTYAFASEPSTGIFTTGSGIFDITLGGVNKIRFNVAGSGTTSRLLIDGISSFSTATLQIITDTFFNMLTAGTTGVPKALRIQPAANTGITASTDNPQFSLLSSTQTWATGALVNVTYGSFGALTANAAAGSAITNLVGYSFATPNTAANTTAAMLNAIQVGSSATLHQVAGTTYGAIGVPAHTITLGNTTQITSVGLSAVSLGKITITQAGATTVDNSSTLYIAGAPIAAGSVTLTNPLSIWIDAGTSRFDGRVLGAQGADVVAANNLVLGTDGNTFEITGATEIQLISNIGWQNGSEVTLLFSSTPVVKHAVATSGTNVTIVLAGSVDMVAVDGTRIVLKLSESGGVQAWREISRTLN